jgi:hypothetical protein
VLCYLPFIVVLVARGITTWRATVGLALLLALQGLTSLYPVVARGS